MNDYLSRLFGKSKFLKGNKYKKTKKTLKLKKTDNVTITLWHDELQLSTQSQLNLTMVEYLLSFTFPGSFPNYSEWEGPDNANFITALFYYFNTSPSVNWETIS